MSRRGSKWLDIGFTVFGVLVIAAMVILATTNVWPYMHEVMWQQSWHPVCQGAHGLEFCKP